MKGDFIALLIHVYMIGIIGEIGRLRAFLNSDRLRLISCLRLLVHSARIPKRRNPFPTNEIIALEILSP